MNDNWIKNPDGSVTTSKWEDRVGERSKIIRDALFEIQNRMPAGQKWSLYSYGACLQIAKHIDERLNKWENK